MYPADQDFIFFFRFKKNYQHFYEFRDNQIICTPKGWLKVSTIGPHVDAVGPAFGKKSVLQANAPPCPHFRTPINGGGFCVPWSRPSHHLRWLVFVVYSLHGKIQSGNIFLYFFCIFQNCHVDICCPFNSLVVDK